jgi:hypothetical protein
MFTSFLQQHTDPAAFVRNQGREHRAIWHDAWRSRLVVAAALLLPLIVLAIAEDNTQIVGLALIALCIRAMAVSVPIMVTHQIQYWLLYMVSPVIVAASFLLGLYPVTPLAAAVSWLLAFLFGLGAMGVDAGVLWVDRRAQEARRAGRSRRAGGPSAEMPELRLQERLRTLRLAVGGGSLILATIVLNLSRPVPLFLVATTFAAWAAGWLRLDALVLCWLRRAPLVACEDGPQECRATYTGRFTLFAPAALIRETIAPEPSPSTASRALLALLQQGSLGPTVRQVAALLPTEQAHALLLHLSLRDGGAEAIRYLRPVLSRSLQYAAACYVALAVEAAAPTDLQRWLQVLSQRHLFDWRLAPGEMQRICQVLALVRDALLCYEYAPVVARAIAELRQLIQTPGEASLETEQWSWPHALLRHLETHNERLHLS